MAGPGEIDGRVYRSIVAGIPLAEPSAVPVLWWYREHHEIGLEHRYVVVMPDGRQPMSGTIWEPVTVGRDGVTDAERSRMVRVRDRLREIDREVCAAYGEDVARVTVDIVGDTVHVADGRPRVEVSTLFGVPVTPSAAIVEVPAPVRDARAGIRNPDGVRPHTDPETGRSVWRRDGGAS